LKELLHAIETLIAQRRTGEGAFRTTLENLISAASCAADILVRSNIEQKRKLIAFVFSNLKLRGKKLEFTCVRPST